MIVESIAIKYRLPFPFLGHFLSGILGGLDLAAMRPNVCPYGVKGDLKGRHKKRNDIKNDRLWDVTKVDRQGFHN